MSDRLSPQNIQLMRGMMQLSPELAQKFDSLVTDARAKAQKLVADLSKLSADGSADSTEAPKKKRGRPAGSKNSKPSKPRVKKDKTVVTEPVVSADALVAEHVTHASAVKSVVTKDGLGAGEIWEALNTAGIVNYNVPTRKVLYTVLSNMNKGGLLKTKGVRPNIKYIPA